MATDMQWTVLNSTYLFKENWFTVRSERCKTPQGKIIDPYYVFEFPNWVNAVALTAEGNILMIRQYRHALGETILEIPGGCMDDTDPSPEAAMRRELLEETGYAFDAVESLGEISPNPSTNTNITYMFLARGGKKIQEQHLDPNEEIEVREYEPAAIVRLLKENKIRQSLHANCLFYAFLKLGWLNCNEFYKGTDMESKHAFNSQTIAKLLIHLDETNKPLWGIMTPQHAVEHLTLSVKASVGKTKPLILVSEAEAAVNKEKLIADDSLWPRGLKNPLLPADSLVSLKYDTLEEAKSKLVAAVEEFETYYRDHPSAYHPNPFLGNLNYEAWLQFHFKHFRHHFIQFGLLENLYDRK